MTRLEVEHGALEDGGIRKSTDPSHWDTSWPLRALQEATGRGQKERNCVYRWGFFSVSLQVCNMKSGIW